MKSIKNQFNLSKKRIIKSIFGLFSLSTMLFVFQACYGTPQDFGQDILLEGKVISEGSENSIQNIEIRLQNLPQYTSSDSEGNFSMFCPRQDQYTFNFRDIDGEDNGSYTNLDSVIKLDISENSLFLSVLLKDK
ncbi:MAG: hypothetical protein KAH17_08840 [Bacteroidales bacterium]|nr:hypothetical protein [Bacteroidales bacterium]